MRSSASHTSFAIVATPTLTVIDSAPAAVWMRRLPTCARSGDFDSVLRRAARQYDEELLAALTPDRVVEPQGRLQHPERDEGVHPMAERPMDLE
jgi:hypothetical protein